MLYNESYLCSYELVLFVWDVYLFFRLVRCPTFRANSKSKFDETYTPAVCPVSTYFLDPELYMTCLVAIALGQLLKG